MTLASIRTSSVLTGPTGAPARFASSGRRTGNRDRNNGTSDAHSSGMASVTYDRESGECDGTGGGVSELQGFGAGTVSNKLPPPVTGSCDGSRTPCRPPVAGAPAVSESGLACSWFDDDGDDCQSENCCGC